MGEDAAAVVPKPAATVVLARDRARSGIEVFLVQRHGSMGFMGGMHVFPGGKVCGADGSDRVRGRIADLAPNASLHHVWGEGVSAGAAVARAVAAVRETFEEAGVLLCGYAARASADRLAELRAALLSGADFGELLERADLAMELAPLQPLSRWVTPDGERVRFDTSFYVARAPTDQCATHDGSESIAADWFAPAHALAAARDGRLRLAPPTALTLESLREADSVEAALAMAARRPPPLVLPIIRTTGGSVMILYPGDPDHPVREPAFEGPTRRLLRRVPD